MASCNASATIKIPTVITMPIAGVHIRPPQSVPQHVNDLDTISLDDRHIVTIMHPGYDDGRNVLFILPGLDHKEGGLDHETALVACGIISSNRWAGFFTSQRDGEPYDRERQTIISAGSYFYYPDAASSRLWSTTL